MNTVLLPVLIASITTFIAILLLRPFAISNGLVDKPGYRKIHNGSIPLVGGIAMYLGVLVGLILISNDLNTLNYYLLSTGILLIIGVIDDHSSISVSLRFLFQLVVSIITTTLGSVVIGSFGNLLGGGDIILNEWDYFVTIIAIIAGMNAVNMTDGIHGLAGGNSLITFLAILYLSIDSSAQEIILIVILFCSVIPVFLIFNLCFGLSENFRIFMGDVGSMIIGLTIVTLLATLSQGEGRSFAPVTALWLFAIPLFEMVFSILRRLTSGKSPFESDFSHIHHLFIRLGLTEKYILLFTLLASLLMAVIGVSGELYEVPERVMFFGFLLVFAAYILLYLVALKRVKLSD